jgi:hypothetical protein
MELQLRAHAVFGADSGSTPSVDFEVADDLTEADFEAATVIAEVADAAWSGWDHEGDPIGARDAVVDALAVTPGVAVVGTSDGDGYGVWWITDTGISYSLLNNPSDTRGGAPQPDAPRFHHPDSGPGTLRPSTSSSTGQAGWMDRQERDMDHVVSEMSLTQWEAFNSGAGNPFGSAEGAAIQALATSSSCPSIPTDAAVRFENGQATVEAFTDNLHAGLLHITTHGQTLFGNRLGSTNKRSEVILMTREAVTGTPNAERRRLVRSRRLVIAMGWGTPYWGIRPRYVRDQLVDIELPDSLVMLGACRSMWNLSMARAFRRGGAGHVAGYDGYVQNSFASSWDQIYWQSLFAYQSTNEAYDSMIAWNMFDARMTMPLVHGDPGMRITDGQIRNPGFEEIGSGSDAPGWTVASLGGQAPWVFNDDSFSLPGLTPNEGSTMAWTEVDMDYGQSYAELQHRSCFDVGQSYTITFDWNFVTSNLAGCTSGNSHWLYLRFYDGTSNTNLWSVDWSTGICPLLTGSGYWRSTGWQTQTLGFTTTTPASTATQLRFSVNSPDWDGIIVLVDDFSVTANP